MPIYNTENYLNKCIESIVNQTYKKLEIILVNDGSTDSSRVICENWLKRDNRIRLVNKKNGGLVSARKEGVKLANGDYIGFVDADDYIETEMYSELYTNLIKSESDFVYGNRIREHEDGTEIADDFNYISGEFELGIKAGVDFLKHYVFNDNNEKQMHKGGIVFALFRKKCICESYFRIPDDCSQGEDIICLTDLILTCKKMYLVNLKLYHYVERHTSLTHKASPLKYLEDCRMVNQILQLCKNNSVYDLLIDNIEEYLNGKMIKNVDMINPQVNCSLYRYPREDELSGKKVVLYAAGCVGRSYYYQFSNNSQINLILWVDSNSETIKNSNVHSIKELNNYNYDFIVIAHTSKKIAEEIRQSLINIGINKEKILYRTPLKNW